MGKEIYLHIKEPCHENWEAMSPDQQGRFCQSCAKRVIDFSRMSDRQILETLSKASGSTCGRFTSGQLERPMVNEKKEIPFFLRPYKIALASMVPLLMLSAEAPAQDNELKGKVAVRQQAIHFPAPMGAVAMIVPDVSLIQGRVLTEDGKALERATIRVKETNATATSGKGGNFSIQYPEGKKQPVLIVTAPGYSVSTIHVPKNLKKPLEIKLTKDEIIVAGMVFSGTRLLKELDTAKTAPKELTINGSVRDENGQPLPFATIVTHDPSNLIMVDSAGNFSFTVDGIIPAIAFSATHTGYQRLVTRLDLRNDQYNDLKLVLEKQRPLDTVIVIGYSTTKCRSMSVGVLSVVEKVTPKDTLQTWTQKIFRNELFTVFPNPVTRGQTLHLRFRQQGDYSLQLFDNSGKLYEEKQIKLAGNGQDMSLVMPATVGSGVYYLKAINTTSKKQYIEKIIVP